MTVGSVGCFGQLLGLILLLELLLLSCPLEILLLAVRCVTAKVLLSSRPSRIVIILCILIIYYNINIIRRKLILALWKLSIEACLHVLPAVVGSLHACCLARELLPFGYDLDLLVLQVIDLAAFAGVVIQFVAV